MSNFPSVKAKDFIKVIENLGFYFDRQKGSHALYKNSYGLRVVVPIGNINERIAIFVSDLDT
ncbi:type II toxin-antitoxin system HicA family toxin [Planktothrix agardhii]|uniref:type II toxin-antitoxin system HicA family toxin n=1 Tax=Planktothrix agardhii TaxID=1160 RepID=UPI001D09EB20|nr:type II toxin-antitoxin system HicA family toxin [Planktothrix agardhii]MCB8784871.1 type II toxin-antitoxin system HicA family toxin [Planktothrix agardhii 1025]MCF3611034.1 type II toxin-antitoxin system HicA family toxin [Planktothrix agardhii 1027]MCF3644687.1 type II toxin-antitoxin system HicA family toxin [Planktothrix agardhii 1026]MCF3647294.1 type II toxin-antitoxin system HicA family toxin [Planktothrix agardhii 1026]CAD5932837.1 hypothetical protein NO2A_01855 [Planktothrix agar